MLNIKDVEKVVFERLKLNDPLIEEADYYFVKSILADKNSSFSFYNYASFLFQLKRYDLAEDCYLECLKLNLFFYPALEEVFFFHLFFSPFFQPLFFSSLENF